MMGGRVQRHMGIIAGRTATDFLGYAAVRADHGHALAAVVPEIAIEAVESGLFHSLIGLGRGLPLQGEIGPIPADSPRHTGRSW